MGQRDWVSLFVLFIIWGLNEIIEKILLHCEMVAKENNQLKKSLDGTSLRLHCSSVCDIKIYTLFK
jgi:hypothetical protein